MRSGTITILAFAALAFALPAAAQPPRLDVIWARSTAGQPITLDGVLNEAAWAGAESKVIQWGVDNGIPGSGYKPEGGELPVDPSFATLKFLVDGNTLYLGAEVSDASVGGSADFNKFDGFLMMIMDHVSLDRPTPPLEHFYSWWYPPPLTNPTAPGLLPRFQGKWAPTDPTVPRDSAQIANWNAVTVVHGQSNDDSGTDTGYTVEMKFNLTADGYDVTQPGGDVVEWNLSLYDCDWLWPLDVAKFSANRTWWQNPWGNTSWYSEVKIHARPDVTINSGPVPSIGPDLRIPVAAGFLPPAIDGALTEPVWSFAPSFDIRYGDQALRNSYPGVGRYRSGQFQPDVNGGQAAILDPGDATVKYFFKEDTLYLGFDVRDQVVQYVSTFDRWDGFIVTLTEYSKRGPDKQLLTQRLSFQVDQNGQAKAQDYLPFLRDTLLGAKLALALKPNTTVDTTGATADEGYTAELAVDLTKLGYPHGRGDGRLFLGITLLDGDSFTPFTDSYGSRTWWFRQYEGENGPVWAYLDPSLGVVGVDDQPAGPRAGVTALRGNFPNPFQANTTIRFALNQPGAVTLEVFDLQGRLVVSRSLGVRTAGDQHALFNRGDMGTGLYLYRLRVADPATGTARSTLSGKMMVVR